MGQALGISAVNRGKFFNQGLKMIDNTILAGDADTLYQFVTEESIYSPEDLDSAEFLHKAALVGNTECVRVLLENDLQVNTVSKRQGYTPLHFAAISPNPGAVLCIKILCKFGAMINHLGDKRCGKTPIHLAIEKGYADAIHELLSHGAKVNIVSECKLGISPLLLALQCQQTKVKDIRIYYALKEILKRLRKDYPLQAQELLMTLVAHGYRPYGDQAKYLENYDLATYGWIRLYTSQPVSLKDQCVKVVRKSMKYNVMYCLHHLKGLQPPIKDDILFNDTPQPCLIIL